MPIIKHTLRDNQFYIIMMRSKGRPPVSPVRLKDGFYIEVFEKGSKSGMKIRSDSKKNMEITADRYIQSKKVVILGEYRDGSPVSTK